MKDMSVSGKVFRYSLFSMFAIVSAFAASLNLYPVRELLFGVVFSTIMLSYFIVSGKRSLTEDRCWAAMIGVATGLIVCFISSFFTPNLWYLYVILGNFGAVLGGFLLCPYAISSSSLKDCKFNN